MKKSANANTPVQVTLTLTVAEARILRSEIYCCMCHLNDEDDESDSPWDSKDGLPYVSTDTEFGDWIDRYRFAEYSKETLPVLRKAWAATRKSLGQAENTPSLGGRWTSRTAPRPHENRLELYEKFLRAKATMLHKLMQDIWFEDTMPHRHSTDNRKQLFKQFRDSAGIGVKEQKQTLIYFMPDTNSETGFRDMMLDEAIKLALYIFEKSNPKDHQLARYELEVDAGL